jgi:N-acetylmuramoyl-L-alanine amidase
LIVYACGDGHGEKTKGKRTPDGYKENFFNNATKIHFIREMKRHGITILDVSPESDDTPLKIRVARANKGINGVIPKYFTSIHFNAYGDGKTYNNAKGIETFYYKSGKKLAEKHYKYLMQGTKQKGRGVKYSSFYVIKYTIMPADLVECGFMTNKEESELMQDPKFQLECGIELAKGSLRELGINWVYEKKEKYKEILKEVSKYYKVWIKFVDKHQDEVNLKGLIEKLYYVCGK